MNNTKKLVVSSLAVAALTSAVTVAIAKENYNLKIEMIQQEKESLERNYKSKIEQLNEVNSNKQATIEYLEKELDSKQKTLDSIIKEQITLTYYTSLPEENGGYTVTCEGKALVDGIVASNYYPLGTKIIIDGKTYTVADRGGKNFDSPKRLDVLIERKEGENNEQYLRRVNDLGRVTKTAYIIK